ncbi:MAG: VWA domain-containing protein [Xanthomonadales bacterium]|nr:VWA domain-containing protein [Xanthomonadales bacterium]
MSGLPAHFHFLRPAALLLLAALPLLWWGWRRGRGDAGGWRGVVDAALLPHLIGRSAVRPSRHATWLAALAALLAVLALAGPAWEREPLPLYRNQAARVIALELAPSMLAADVKPSRLERARYKIDDILARSRDHQTALVGYAGDAFVAAPLTDDVATVRNLVAVLAPDVMPVAGNDTARAIQAAVELIRQAGLRKGEIVLLADSAGAGAEAAARQARDAGISVSVLGVGSDAGAPVPLADGGFASEAGQLVLARRDEAGLRALARAGGGHYAALAVDATDLDTVLAASVDPAGRGETDGLAEGSRWRDRGPWLLLGLLPLALAGFRRGWLMVFAAALVLPAGGVRAAGWADFWQRPDQQAARALGAGDAARAAALAADPAWRASAHYQGGDFAAAAEGWQGAGGADAAYNRGNALARLGRFKDALGAYDEALALAPGMEDALANRALVEQALQQQQDEQAGQGEEPQPGDSGDSQQDARSTPPQRSADGAEGEGAEPATMDGEAPRAESEQRAPSQGRDESGAGADRTGAPAAAGEAPPPDAAQRDALARSIDQALASEPGDPEQAAAALDAAPEDAATREKQQALEHLLQRVPDDPGGLLRRKFQLEYQRRQQGGDPR